MTVHSGGNGKQAGTSAGGGDGSHTVTRTGTGAGGGDGTHRRLAMVDVPPFTDGAVAELRHGGDGTVIAEIRIPGPPSVQAADHG